jgi:hypothetical protein
VGPQTARNVDAEGVGERGQGRARTLNKKRIVYRTTTLDIIFGLAGFFCPSILQMKKSFSHPTKTPCICGKKSIVQGFEELHSCPLLCLRYRHRFNFKILPITNFYNCLFKIPRIMVKVTTAGSIHSSC